MVTRTGQLQLQYQKTLETLYSLREEYPFGNLIYFYLAKIGFIEWYSALRTLNKSQNNYFRNTGCGHVENLKTAGQHYVMVIAAVIILSKQPLRKKPLQLVKNIHSKIYVLTQTNIYLQNLTRFQILAHQNFKRCIHELG